MADQMVNTGGNNTGSQPENTAQRDAEILAAMMEELGTARKDTLALADGNRDRNTPLTPLALNRPMNAGVAAWQNARFDDGDEAESILDSIADGQLYRMRRAAEASNQSSSIRGGHSSHHISRGGRGGSVSSARGSPDTGRHFGNSTSRGGRGGSSLSGRGGRGGFRNMASGDGRNSDSTPTVFHNDASRGVRSNARADKTIAILEGRNEVETMQNTMSGPPSRASTPPTKSAPAFSLAPPSAFMEFMKVHLPGKRLEGSGMRSANLLASGNDAQAAFGRANEDTATTGSIVTSASDTIIPKLMGQSAPDPVQVTGETSSALPTVISATVSLPGSAPATVHHGIPFGSLVPAVIVVDRSNGLPASRWATTQPAPTPRYSLNTSSVSDTVSSIPSTFNSVMASLHHTQNAPGAAESSKARETLLPPHSVPSVLATSTSIATNTGDQQRSSSTASNFEGMKQAPLTRSGRSTGALVPSPRVETAGTILSGNTLIQKTIKANRNGSNDKRIVIARLVQTMDSVINLEIEQNGSYLYNADLLATPSCQSTDNKITLSDGHSGINVLELFFDFPHEVKTFERYVRAYLDEYSNASKATESAALSTDEMLIDFDEISTRAQSPLPRARSAANDLEGLKISSNPMVGVILNLMDVANLIDNRREEEISLNIKSKTLEFMEGAHLVSFIPEHERVGYIEMICRSVLLKVKERWLRVDREQTTQPLEFMVSQKQDDTDNRLPLQPPVIPQQASTPLQDFVASAKDSALMSNSRHPKSSRQVRKYAISELTDLKQPGSIPEALIERLEECKMDAKSPFRAPHELPPRRASQMSLLSPASSVSKVVDWKFFAEAPADTGMEGFMLSEIKGRPSVMSSSTEGTKAKHCPSSSDVDVRLSEKFSGLQLTHSTLANNSLPSSDRAKERQVTIQEPHFSDNKTESEMKASAPPFVPSPSTQPRAENGRTESMPSVTYSKSIIPPSNKKEDMAKAKIAGLGFSRWASNSPGPDVLAEPRTQTPLTSPAGPQMQTMTGPEVIGPISILSHQVVSPLPQFQENMPSQSVAPFPQRQDTSGCHPSGATAPSDPKSSQSSTFGTTSPQAPRQPLSPKKWQARLNDSLSQPSRRAPLRQ